MVYGLNIQPEYGKFPKVEPLDDRFDRNFVLKRDYRHLLDEHVLPDKIHWKDSAGRKAPDFDNTPLVNVSQRAKDIIESMEPGVHRFEPVEYLYSKGATETRFWLHVGHQVDGVNGERSNMVLAMSKWYPAKDLARRGVTLPDRIDSNAPSKLVFDRKAIAPYHLWRDKHLSSVPNFISDTLGERFKAEGITGLRLDEDVVECA